eukprot:scaffold13236_cov82-Cyclotella_meneghiniana.AAC.2
MERMVRVDGVVVVVGWIGLVKAVAVRVSRDERTKKDFMVLVELFVGPRTTVDGGRMIRLMVNVMMV